MRNEASFPKGGLLSDQISQLTGIPGQSAAEQHTLLMHILEVLKNDRARFKATGKLTPTGDANMVQMSLKVAREINSLRAENNSLSTLAKQPEQYISALSDVLNNLNNAQASRLNPGMPSTLLSKVTQSITHTIDALKDTAVNAAVTLRPEGKPPPQNLASALTQAGSSLRSAWSSAVRAIIPASRYAVASLGFAAVAAHMTSSTGINTASPTTVSVTPVEKVVLKPTPLPPVRAVKAAAADARKSVAIPQGLVHNAPHVIREVEEKAEKAIRRTARNAKENLDNLFQKPEVLSIAFQKLQNLKVDVAFRKAVLVESGGRQFDKDGNPLTSHKGATGTAQVMPDTAEKIAKPCTREPLDKERYLNDADYNYKLGKCYYRARTAAYGGNTVMGAMDYNLGPVRMQKHIAKVGDPTKGEISLVKFIETMPIRETRHYPLQMLKKSGLLEEAQEEHNQAQAAALADSLEQAEANTPAPTGP